MTSACVKKPGVVGNNDIWSILMQQHFSFLNWKIIELYKHKCIFFTEEKTAWNEMSVFIKLFHPFMPFLVNGYLHSCSSRQGWTFSPQILDLAATSHLWPVFVFCCEWSYWSHGNYLQNESYIQRWGLNRLSQKLYSAWSVIGFPNVSKSHALSGKSRTTMVAISKPWIPWV